MIVQDSEMNGKFWNLSTFGKLFWNNFWKTSRFKIDSTVDWRCSSISKLNVEVSTVDWYFETFDIEYYIFNLWYSIDFYRNLKFSS